MPHDSRKLIERELLPCPWPGCGAPAKVTEFGKEDFVSCSNERCPIADVSALPADWNRRASAAVDPEAAVRLLRVFAYDLYNIGLKSDEELRNTVMQVELRDAILQARALLGQDDKEGG